MFEYTRNQVRKYGARAAAGAVALVPLFSHAAIDVTAVTAGITDAQVAILAIITALMGLSVAIFGLAKAYAFVKRRAGA